MSVNPPPRCSDPPSKNILGVAVASLSWDDAIRALSQLVAERRFTKVAFLNANSANIAWRSLEFARALRSFLVLPDGVGVDLAAKILHGSRFPANLNGTDFVPALLRSISTPLTIGLLGAMEPSTELAARELMRVAEQHRVEFIHHGFIPEQDLPNVLEQLIEVHPDILLVGMGVPRQELFIDERITARHCTMPIAVGGLLDFLSGSVPRAPPWVRACRLEWVFRLWTEPTRLWRRYVLGNPAFLVRVAKQKFFDLRSLEERS